MNLLRVTVCSLGCRYYCWVHAGEVLLADGRDGDYEEWEVRRAFSPRAHRTRPWRAPPKAAAAAAAVTVAAAVMGSLAVWGA